MGGRNKIETDYLLDACSIVNLLHIDEEEVILKTLAEFNFRICKKVSEELQKNAFIKFKRINPYPQGKHKLIEIKLNYFRERIHYNEDYLEMIEEVSNQTNYSKLNGELLSVVLSFFLNTYEYKTVVFVTDDYPAKTHFSPYYDNYGIGSLEDTVDLLNSMYNHSKSFSRNDLKKFLSSLYSEYATEISLFEKRLNSIEVPSHLLRNKDITYNLHKLRFWMKNFSIYEVIEIYELVESDKKRFKFLYDLLEPFSYFFYKNSSKEYLNKIQEAIANT